MSFGDTIKTFSDNSENILIDLESICNQYGDICEEWHLTKFNKDLTLTKMFSDVKSKISSINKKIEREEMICVVFGRVNSGKSMFVNALLGRDILPTGNGLTTNSFVEIRKSDDNTDYVIFPDSHLRMDISSINRVDFADGSLHPGSNIKVYLSGNKCGILKENVVIVDTPGIDIDKDIDTINYEMCKKADLLIMVVNSTNDINETDKNFLLKYKINFPNFKLLIIFNHWDLIVDLKPEILKIEYSKSAKKLLCDDFQLQDSQGNDGIFFISALERSKISNSEIITTIGLDERNLSFDSLLVSLNKYWRVSNNQRRLTLKRENFEIINKTIERIRVYRIDVLQKITDKVYDALSKLIDTNEFINKAVDNLFTKCYEDYFNRGLDIIKQKDSKLENKTTLRNSFIFEQMTVMIESLKITIIDFVSKNEAIDKAFVTLTFEQLFFQYYVNADNHIEVIKSCQLYSELQTKLKKILKNSYNKFWYRIPNDISKSILETEYDLDKFRNQVYEYNEKWEPLFMQTSATTQIFISDEENLLKRFEIVCQQHENICEEWSLRKSDEETCKLDTDVKYDIIYNNKKLERKETICLVFGRVSSGKSMLINSMLGRNILPSDNGSTTSCFVSIRKSDDDEEFVILPGSSDKLDIKNIIQVDFAKNKLHPGSRVDLFLSGYQCNILKDNLVIIDTPGIDTDADMDVITHDMCKQVDLLILVINSINDISDTDRNFLLKYKTIFSKFKLLIVFNHWDEIKDSKKEFVKAEYYESAIKYLCHDLGVKSNEAEERIFFLSAMEKIEITNNENLTSAGWEKRDQSFDCFIRIFNQCIDGNVDERLSTVMKNNLEIIVDGLHLVKKYKSDLQDRFTKKVNVALNHLIEMNNIINKRVETLFVQNYEIFFYRGLNTMKVNESELENAASVMNVFISEQMVVIVESLKIIINEMITGLDDKEKDFIMKSMEKLYFCNYVNTDAIIEVIKKSDLYPVFNEILTTIRKHRKFAIAGISLAGTVIIAPIGVGIGIVAPVIDAIAIPVAVVSFAGVGSVGGAISSKLALMKKEMERAVFKPRYADLEFHLLIFWDRMKDILIDSYDRFLEKLPTIISLLISKNGNDFNDLEDEVNQFKEKWEYQITQ